VDAIREDRFQAVTMPLGFGSLKDFRKQVWVVAIAVATLCLAVVAKILGIV